MYTRPTDRPSVSQSDCILYCAVQSECVLNNILRYCSHESSSRRTPRPYNDIYL